MSKPFLVIIDTTEARIPQGGIGVGILNAHIILADNDFQAKQKLLQIFRPNVQNIVKNYLYAYDINEIQENLVKYNQEIFAFMPLAGGRPPRQSFSPAPKQIENGNKTLSANLPEVKATTQQQTPVSKSAPQRTVNNTKIPNDIRGRGFNNNIQDAPSTTDVMDVEQSTILASLGVTPQKYGGNEGSQPRINASIGSNQNLSQISKPRSVSDNLSEDQAALLQAVGVNHIDQTVIKEDTEDEVSKAFVDPSLTEVDNVVLTETEIEKLKNEIKES